MRHLAPVGDLFLEVVAYKNLQQDIGERGSPRYAIFMRSQRQARDALK